ncbi:MAG: GNAT family N-acetyltransferase [Myxococcota bacterium]
MHIVIAGPTHLEAIRRLLEGQFKEHSIELSSDALTRAILGPLEQPSRGTFFLAEDGECVGLAYLAYTWTLEHAGRSAWLEELYVVPARRGQGIGTRLLREALAHAAKLDCCAIDLEIESGHERAGQLYAREGFRAHRRTRWYLKL